MNALELGHLLVVELQDDYCGDGRFVVVSVTELGLLKEEWVFHSLNEAIDHVEFRRKYAAKKQSE